MGVNFRPGLHLCVDVVSLTVHYVQCAPLQGQFAYLWHEDVCCLHIAGAAQILLTTRYMSLVHYLCPVWPTGACVCVSLVTPQAAGAPARAGGVQRHGE